MRSALLLACACALALLGAARAQAPVATAFLDRLMDGKQQLTAEQAESVQGVWNMTHHVRLDGPTVDKKLIEALDASDDDFSAALDDAVVNSNVISMNFIPVVDPRTGMFAAYSILTKDGKLIDLQRFLGVALGQKDGSVLLQAANSEDTGIATSLVKGDRMVRLWLEGLEVVRRNETQFQDGVTAAQYTGQPEIIDNQAVGLLEYTTLPKSEVQAVAERVASELKKKWE